MIKKGNINVKKQISLEYYPYLSKSGLNLKL